MPSAQPAYRYGAFAPAENPRTTRITSVPGTRRAPREQHESNVTLVTLAKFLIVAMVIVAIASIVRITLASATVTTMVEGDNISSEIAEARSAGTELEVAQATLTAPAALKDKAEDLNMSVATDISTIALAEDVVVKDSAGNLSLSLSVQTATRI